MVAFKYRESSSLQRVSGEKGEAAVTIDKLIAVIVDLAILQVGANFLNELDAGSQAKSASRTQPSRLSYG